jgi:adenine phosphoribosyltransferase
VVGASFLIELGYLPGREKLGSDIAIHSLITY